VVMAPCEFCYPRGGCLEGGECDQIDQVRGSAKRTSSSQQAVSAASSFAHRMRGQPRQRASTERGVISMDRNHWIPLAEAPPTDDLVLTNRSARPSHPPFANRRFRARVRLPCVSGLQFGPRPFARRNIAPVATGAAGAHGTLAICRAVSGSLNGAWVTAYAFVRLFDS